MGIRKSVVGTGFVGVVAALAGCSAESTPATSSSEVIARVQSSIQSGTVNAINGSYTGCVNRTGQWSVEATASAYTLPNQTLSVVMNDTSCQLDIEEVVLDGEVYTASSPLVLGASFSQFPATFQGQSRSFFANAMRTSDFSTNFDIVIVQSGEPSESLAGNRVAEYATVQASSVTTTVPASNYSLDLQTASPIRYSVNANQTVLSSSGTATLVHGSSAAGHYAIDMGTLAPGATYAQVATVWDALVLGNKSHTLAAGADVTFNASDFELVGKTLSSPLPRTVILTREEAGVVGFQLIRVTFSGGPQ